jgi:multidrug efflux system outer membrane protein
MRRTESWPLLLLLLLLGGCAVGPGFHPPTPVPAGQQLGAAGPADTLRSFFDSLTVARRDTMARPAPVMLTPDPATDLQWLDLLRDSTLVGLIETAVRGNRNVQTAVARIREYRASLGVARGDLFPQVNANGSVATQQSVFGSFGAQKFDAFRATADLSWELDFWGRIRRNVEAANADLGAQDAASRATLLTLVSDVSQAYLELRELDADIAIAERTLLSRRQTLQLAQRRFQQGLISELDVLQFEAAVAQPAASVADFQRQRSQKEHQLSLLLGEAPGVIPRGLPLETVVANLTVPDSISSLLVARRPDIQLAEQLYRAANARIGVAQGNRLPRITITGQYGTQAQNLSTMFQNNTEIYTAQAGISIPLFAGGKYVNQTRAASARAEQARLQYEQTVLVALRETSDALVGVRASRDQVTAQRIQATALRRALQLAEKRYENGISSYLDVLDAQRSLFTAEVTLAQVQRQYLVSTVQLYKALGGSWVSAAP